MSGLRHGVSMQIISRHPNVWRAKCGRHAEWTGPTYEAVEDQWRQHVYEETGKAPTPSGDKSERWMP